MTDLSITQQLARELHDAERRAIAGPPLSTRYPRLVPADAYAIQEHYARLREGGGAIQVGRKIGVTSRAMQEFFGIDTPDWGYLFDDMVIPDGGVVPTSELIAPMVEPEIAFKLGRDLAGADLTISDVLAATDAVAPALEIIDSRIVDWQVGFVDTVADNGSSARCVFGPQTSFTPALDLKGECVRFFRNGEQIDTAPGTAVLGDPAAAVAWLGKSLAEFGGKLRAGDWVLSGSLTRAAPALAGQHYEARFDELGSVTSKFS